jgi:hypothetical protein
MLHQVSHELEAAARAAPVLFGAIDLVLSKIFV